MILEEVTGVPSLDPTMVSFESKFIEHAKELVPGPVALREKVFPLKHEGNYVHLVMSLPNDEACIRRMEFNTGSRIKPYCCCTNAIIEAINAYYDDIQIEKDALPDDVTLLIESAVLSLNRLKMAGTPVTAVRPAASRSLSMRMQIRNADWIPPMVAPSTRPWLPLAPAVGWRTIWRC